MALINAPSPSSPTGGLNKRPGRLLGRLRYMASEVLRFSRRAQTRDAPLCFLPCLTTPTGSFWQKCGSVHDWEYISEHDTVIKGSYVCSTNKLDTQIALDKNPTQRECMPDMISVPSQTSIVHIPVLITVRHSMYSTNAPSIERTAWCYNTIFIMTADLEVKRGTPRPFKQIKPGIFPCHK